MSFSPATISIGFVLLLNSLFNRSMVFVVLSDISKNHQVQY